MSDSSTPVTPQTKRVLPIHPILFAAFPILTLYRDNIDQVSVRQVIWPLVFSVCAAVIVWAVFAFITRSGRKAAVTASLIIMPFMSYRHIVVPLPQSIRWLAAVAFIVIIAALIVLVLRSRKALLDTTKVLNLASVVLVLPSCWGIGVGVWSALQSTHRAGDRVARLSESSSREGTAKRQPVRRASPVVSAKLADQPDVYYIILDAYGRSDSLKVNFQYDNAPFIRALEQRGFYITKKSRANYDETPLCLASSLNMTYLDDLAKKTGASGSLEACREAIDDNEVALYLSRLGYHFVFIGSGVGQVEVQTADVLLNNEPDPPLFEEEARNLVPLPVNAPEQHKRFDQHRHRLLGVFSNLKSVANLHYPKFVFAHILAPHPPFVFGANGEAVDPKGALSFADGSWLLGSISREQYIHGYINQLRYINSRTLEVVDDILKQSDRTPIIIIQGDHGSRMNLDWNSLEKTELREPFSILNAYLVPKSVRKDLYETITPVNSFRIVLNDAFGANYSRLPDRSFYSTADAPFDFVDVTARIPTSSRPDRTQSAPPVRSAAPGGAAR